ncbi:MAG: thermonuclease family protein [Clostridiales Family XIII bacterium]|jgi:micrococcal nuclease|nr:thermonuclease family protein [Clostridiales Family XIII bacterium]
MRVSKKSATALIAVLIAIALIYFALQKDKDEPEWQDTMSPYTVTDVIDGDTFTVSTGEKVRLIGIDTPEVHHSDEKRNVPFGEVASEYTRSLLLGKSVILEFDEERTDKYGRLLAYVYLEDGIFFNESLVRKGYARTMTIPPNVTYEKLLNKAEREAKRSGIGIWEDYENIFPK